MVMPSAHASTAAHPAFPAVDRNARLDAYVAGVRFREVMTGMITKGATDPVQGYADPAAVAMVLRAAVVIPNLSSFLRDPDHGGTWNAGGEIPVWGARITSEGDGDFGLFRRSIRARKGVRQLVYDSHLTVGGQRYWMQGRKTVEPGPPWRAWAATTTLHVRFFAPDALDRPVAAGILRLSPSAFARQMLTLRADGRVSLLDKLSALGRFLRFFAGSLVRTYVFWRRW